MFATELDLLLIGTIEVPIHTKLISKLVHIIDFSIAKLVPNNLLNRYVFQLST
jgi:hypothetical protein